MTGHLPCYAGTMRLVVPALTLTLLSGVFAGVATAQLRTSVVADGLTNPLAWTAQS